MICCIIFFAAISRRKLEMPAEMVIRAINNLDLKQLSLENVEILQKMVPTEQEVKAYREYIGEKKDLNLLTDEDKFMMQLAKVERISSKLSIMNYIGNFFDSIHLISPVSLFLLIYWQLNLARVYFDKLSTIRLTLNFTYWNLDFILIFSELRRLFH